jgi:hypothetical protein
MNTKWLVNTEQDHHWNEHKADGQCDNLVLY